VDGRRRSRFSSRAIALAERRSSLVRLLIALFVARIVVTITEVIESELTFFSAVVTAAIGIEAWRAWRVARTVRAEPARAVELPDNVWNRVLLPLERRGPPVLYVLTAAYAVAYVVVLAVGESHETLLLAAQIGREVITLVFLGVLIAGYLSVRSTLKAEPPPEHGEPA
jgi:hypothetical protein